MRRTGREPRPAPSGAGARDALAVSARPRPHHPLDRVSPAEAQDAGLRLSRGRPLPHPADPQPRSGADRPRRSAARSGSTRTSPRRWRSRTTSATPRSAMPARRRSTPRWRRYRRLLAQRPDLAHPDPARARLCRVRRAQPDLGDARRHRQAQRPAARRRHRAPVPPTIAEYDRAIRSPRHLPGRRGAGRRARRRHRLQQPRYR